MSNAHDSHDHSHAVPLWGLFLALLAFTAAEVGFFEYWSHTLAQGHPIVPKYVMVLTILIVLTLPKAAIVLIYFMHLKFEKVLVVGSALIPFAFAAICVLPTLTDIKTLKSDGKTYNLIPSLEHYNPHNQAHGEDAHNSLITERDKPEESSHAPEAKPAPKTETAPEPKAETKTEPAAE